MKICHNFCKRICCPGIRTATENRTKNASKIIHVKWLITRQNKNRRSKHCHYQHNDTSIQLFGLTRLIANIFNAIKINSWMRNQLSFSLSNSICPTIISIFWLVAISTISSGYLGAVEVLLAPCSACPDLLIERKYGDSFLLPFHQQHLQCFSSLPSHWVSEK